jgi:hypothetical protein
MSAIVKSMDCSAENEKDETIDFLLLLLLLEMWPCIC